MRDFKALGLAFVLLPALAASSDAAKPVLGRGDAQSCAALAGKAIAPNTVIESADYLPDGGTVGTTKVSVPFCRVVGVATPTADSHIGFEVWLPPASAGTAISAAKARAAAPARSRLAR